MSSPSINVAVEGNSDEAVARKLVEQFGFQVRNTYVQNGKAGLDKKLHAFNQAARIAPWFVLRDLDFDADCSPKLVEKLLPGRFKSMCFRVAVRAVEAWLLADRINLSQFLHVPSKKIPVAPDQLDHPKTELVNLARKSRKSAIRQDMVPPQRATTQVGPAYVSRIMEFAQRHWNPLEAANHSESLQKCLSALNQLQQESS